jgi:hypothetical protein
MVSSDTRILSPVHPGTLALEPTSFVFARAKFEGTGPLNHCSVKARHGL